MLSLTTIRFFPNLEEIPEESRCSTIMKERKEDEGEKCLQLHQGESESGNRLLTTTTRQAKVLKIPFQGEEGSESSGSNSGLGSLENREDGGGTGKSNHQVTFDSDGDNDDFACNDCQNRNSSGPTGGGISSSENMF